MRANGITVTNQRAYPQQTPRNQTTSNQNLLPRRAFLQLALASIGFIPSIINADETSDFEGKLTAGFNELLTKPDIELNFDNLQTSPINGLITTGKKDLKLFSDWYKKQANSNETIKDKKKVLLLESLGKRVIVAGAGSYSNPHFPDDYVKNIILQEDHSKRNKNIASEEITLKRAEIVMEILSDYTKLTENTTNNSSDTNLKKLIAANTLKTCDAIIYPGYQNIRTADYKINGTTKGKATIRAGTEIINLYEASLKCVRSLIEQDPKNVDVGLKGLICEPPYDIEGFDDQTDLQDRVINILSENYFGIEKNYPDFDGFAMFLSKNNGTFGWSPYLVYGIMARNPKFFKSLIESSIEELKQVAPHGNPKIGKSLDPVDEIIKIVKHFSVDSFNKRKQGFHFSYRLTNSTNSTPAVPAEADTPMPGLQRPFQPPAVPAQPVNSSPQKPAVYVPAIPDKIKNDVAAFIENLMRPVSEAITYRLENEAVEVEDKVIVGEGTERLIHDDSWKYLNKRLPELIEAVGSNEKLKEVVSSKLEKTTEPYARERIYKSLGIISCKGLKENDYSASHKRLRADLANAASVPEIRGLAFSCAYGLNRVSSGISMDIFMTRLEKIVSDAASGPKPNEEKSPQEELIDLAKEKLNPQQQLMIDAMRLVLIDVPFAISLMPDKKIPPPEKKVVMGEEVIVNNEEIRKSVRQLKKIFHNAFTFLIYTAEKYSSEEVNPDLISNETTKSYARRICKVAIGLSDKYLRYHFTELDGPRNAEFWGEKIGALMELYNNDYSGESPEEREKVFQGLLFEGNDSSKKRYGEATPIFKILEENLEHTTIKKVGDQIGIRLGGLFIDSREHKERTAEIKRSEEFKKATFEDFKYAEKIKAGIIEGTLHTAEHRKLRGKRISLKAIGKGGHFEDRMLLDPYGNLKYLYNLNP